MFFSFLTYLASLKKLWNYNAVILHLAHTKTQDNIIQLLIIDSKPMAMATTKENFEHESPKYYYWKGEDLYIALYIQARAKHNKIVGKHGDRLKIQITAPPIEGKANNEIIKFFAGFFAIPKTQIKLVSGLQGRNKLLQVMSPNRKIELLLIRADT